MDAALFGAAAFGPSIESPALIRNTTFEPVFLRSPGLPAPGFGDKVEIRVVMPCNQDCTFCREPGGSEPDLETRGGRGSGDRQRRPGHRVHGR